MRVHRPCIHSACFVLLSTATDACLTYATLQSQVERGLLQRGLLPRPAFKAARTPSRAMATALAILGPTAATPAIA